MLRAQIVQIRAWFWPREMVGKEQVVYIWVIIALGKQIANRKW